MREQNCNYLSYLLRIWQDSSDGEWHATLQDVFGDDCYHFASLTELYRNLEALTSARRVHFQEETSESFGAQLSELRKRTVYAKKNN